MEQGFGRESATRVLGKMAIYEGVCFPPTPFSACQVPSAFCYDITIVIHRLLNLIFTF